jgi:hypothetical protein
MALKRGNTTERISPSQSGVHPVIPLCHTGLVPGLLPRQVEVLLEAAAISHQQNVELALW